ncbi:predicted protein [Naegleria gruberi]|uniref:Predicted protein n=1 Tax=Naegleria gruberi TaxID=5762 RepID=D2VD70_NAEGR|nr:uncharacterized protein NAEGRDRAFT_66927 [Naegleria gruberi]EFC45279.1 predicted protein [Naegleria gruberi]|eukprot:XP_002678023.1 predicted protein [Naegleria gruberi strain NEG-M]
MSSSASSSSFIVGEKDPPFNFSKPAYEVAQAPNAIISGMLNKQDRKMGVMWRKRFFILIYKTGTTTTTTANSSLNLILNQQQQQLGISSSNVRASVSGASSSRSNASFGLTSFDSNTTDILLYYFKNPTDQESISSISIRFGVELVEAIQFNKVKRFGIKIVTKSGREYFLCCDDENEQKKWLNYLNLAKQGSTAILNDTKESQPVPVSSPNLTIPSKLNVVHKHLTATSTATVSTPPSLPPKNLPIVPSKIDENSKRWNSWSLNQCQLGCKVMKLPYLGACSGVEKKRFLQLSKNGNVIRWGTQTIHSSTAKMSQEEDDNVNQLLDRHLNISQVSAVYHGVSTNTFQRYLEKTMNGYDCGNCLSISVKTKSGKNRTIDLIFQHADDAMAWFLFLNMKINPSTNSEQALTEFKWNKLKLGVQQSCFTHQNTTLGFMEEQVYLI